ncbi:hypothetical protein [Streptomyces sp. NPDC058486]|uniref:hypothetical protein n=1 Tax=unclassified Streptomyces TaxID=2593676 RepID=UPI0036595027
MPFIQLTTPSPAPGASPAPAVAGRLAEEFAGALGLPDGAVIVQHVVAETVTGPGAVAVVRGRPRDAALTRRAVDRAGAVLSEALGVHPDLVLVSWPHPGTSATGGEPLA